MIILKLLLINSLLQTLIQAVSLIVLHLNCCIMPFYTNKLSFHKTFTVPCEESKAVSFASSIIKNTVVFPALSIFAVKLIIKKLILNLHQKLVAYLNLLQSLCKDY